MLLVGGEGVGPSLRRLVAARCTVAFVTTLSAWIVLFQPASSAANFTKHTKVTCRLT